MSTTKSLSITVVIHTRNEENHIVACIKSAQNLSPNIVVIDMESTDKTCKRASEAGAKVVTTSFSYYVEPARGFGIQQAKTPWVFILDADERISPELAQEIHNLITQTDHTHFKVPRKNIFGTKWLKYGGWSPDYQLRLINTGAFQSWPAAIHSTPRINGTMGYLKNTITHFFHGNFEKMVEKTMIFENIESDLLFKAGRKSSTLIFFRKFAGELFRRLIKNKGYRDGTVGIMESIYQAYSKTITYLYLYEKQTSSSI
ncbi:glycosyltransferase family 2 protein [Candidatus Roizmanbacteria bacterium]|nr:glycosyltransferase family 2 protein [Candidatus Roizmanbacteria bacterium]